MKIPFLSFEKMNQLIKAEVLESFERFFDSGWYVLGKEVEEFERQYANYSNTKYCVGVSNGLDALHLSLKALGISSGDEVIVPSNTYIATALAVTYTGAKVVFVEPNSGTYNMDPNRIAEAITANTKAIIPVHLYGLPCEMDPILTISKKYGLKVIEDNAQSQGAEINGRKTGSFGDINAVSFYPGKNLGALGEAGAITTSDQELADMVKILRNYGSSKKYLNDYIGYNNRIDACQASILKVKLKHLDNWNEERRKVANHYQNHLQKITEIELPQINKGAKSVFHQYVIKCEKRDLLKQFLERKGIGTLIHYPIPPYLQKAYRHLGYKKGDFPIADRLAATMLSLPIYPGINEQQVKFISYSIKEFYLIENS